MLQIDLLGNMILESKFNNYKVKHKGGVIEFDNYIAVVDDNLSVEEISGFGRDFWIRDGRSIKSERGESFDWGLRIAEPFREYMSLKRVKNVDIIVCVYNAYGWTKKCIEAVQRFTILPYTLAVVNDCSNKYMTEYLRTIPNIRLIENEVNLGYLKSANKALKLATSEYVIFLNSDALVTPGWLENMIQAAESDPKIMFVNPLTNEDCNFGQIQPPERSFWEMHKLITHRSDYTYPEIVAASGFCLMIKKEAIDKYGGFDEAYGFGYGEETDYILRATKDGYRCVVADNAYVYHRNHGSVGAAGAARMKNENHGLFIKRNGDELAKREVQTKSGVEIAINKLAALKKKSVSIGYKIGIILPLASVTGGPRTIVELANDLFWLGYNTTLILKSNAPIHPKNQCQCPVVYNNNLEGLDDYDLLIINEMDADSKKLFKYKAKKVLFILAHGEPSHDVKDMVLGLPFDEAIVTSEYLYNVVKGHKSPTISFPITKVGWRPYRDGEFYPDRKERKYLQVGMLYSNDPQKKYEEGLNVFDSVRNGMRAKGIEVRFVTYGFGSDPKSRSYITHLQDPSAKEMNEMFNNTDVWLMSSVTEGVGYSGMEALLCECAVVAPSDNGGANDYINNGASGGLVVDRKDLAEGVIKLLLDDKLRMKLAKAGREYILENYNDLKYDNAVLTVLKRIILKK